MPLELSNKESECLMEESIKQPEELEVFKAYLRLVERQDYLMAWMWIQIILTLKPEDKAKQIRSLWDTYLCESAPKRIELSNIVRINEWGTHIQDQIVLIQSILNVKLWRYWREHYESPPRKRLVDERNKTKAPRSPSRLRRGVSGSQEIVLAYSGLK